MSKIIGFGECSKFYLYILCTVIIKALKDLIFGFSDIDQRKKEDFLIIKPVPLFCKHNIIQNILRYLGIILGGFISLKIFRKNTKITTSLLKPKEELTQNSTSLIYKDQLSDKIKRSEILKIAIIVCIHYELRKLLFLMNFFFIEFWTINVIFLLYFMYKFFNIQYYNYQKCSLLFIIITNTILLLINTIIPQERMNNKNEFDLYEETMGKAVYCIPFILVFIFLSFIISYARVKIKLITYINFVFNFTIIIFIGICGIFLTIIEIIFSESLKCNRQEMNETFQTLCLVNNTNNEWYHDEIGTFFVNFGDLSAKEIFINIMLILFFPIICFLEILLELLIIYYLNPIYILIRENIYYFCLRIIFVSLRINNDFSDYMSPRFFILESAELLALLGYCVYLQLIELKFCKLDKNLDKNIQKRADKEVKKIIPMHLLLDNDTDKNNEKSEKINQDEETIIY